MIAETKVVHITSRGLEFAFPADYPRALREAIENVYRVCSKKACFPEDACWWTSSRLKSVGLPQKSGYFLLDMPLVKDRGNNVCHNWNVDSKERIVDLTLPQMNNGLKEKVVTPIVIIDTDTEFHKRFSVTNTQFSWEK